jgi:hypothetical protein
MLRLLVELINLSLSLSLDLDVFVLLENDTLHENG